MKTLLVLLMLAGFCVPAEAQRAYYRGRTYSHRVCNNPNCAMCNAIENRIQRQRSVSVSRSSVVQSAPTVAPVSTERVVISQRRVCRNGVCYLEPVYGTVTAATPVVVPPKIVLPPKIVAPKVAPKVVKRKPPPPKAAENPETQPSSRKSRLKAFELLALTPRDVLADPGCGDGSLLIDAVEAYGCRGVGVEIDVSMAIMARRAVLAAEREGRIPEGSIEIITGDAADFSPAEYGVTKAVVFLFPRTLAALRSMLSDIPLVASINHQIPQSFFADRGGNVYLYRWDTVRATATSTSNLRPITYSRTVVN